MMFDSPASIFWWSVIKLAPAWLLMKNYTIRFPNLAKEEKEWAQNPLF
jgi:hypothetical protein